MFGLRQLMLAIGVALLSVQETAATTISFSPSDLVQSTVTTTTTLFGGLTQPTAPALPADGTFTISPINPSLNYLEGKFWRFTFTLPSVFTDLEFNFSAVVNDEFAVYVNDKVVAIQDDTGVSEFTAGFQLFANGSSSATGALDYLNIFQTDFLVGLNEITIYGTDTCCAAGIGPQGTLASFSATLDYDAPAPVPIPAALPLFLTGLAGVGWVANRRKKPAA